MKLSGGCRLAYREYGDADGPLVFYFHGTPGSRLEAALVADDARLAGVRLVSVDRSGLGFLLSAIQHPSVSIWQGGCDRVVTPSMGRYFNSQIAGSEQVIDPTAGHVTTLKCHAGKIFSRFV